MAIHIHAHGVSTPSLCRIATPYHAAVFPHGEGVQGVVGAACCGHEAERAERAIKDAIAYLKEAVKEKEPPPPNLDFSISPDDQEMYFREPGQLLSVYQALEESNLFYIQNAQETEEALEELRTKYRDTKQRLDGEVASLNSQVASLRGAIDAAQGKARRLKERTIEDVGSLTLAMGGAAGGPAISLDQLTTKVAEVYVRCGFDADKSVGTLQMLTNIESKLEEYLGIVDGMPPEFVESSEKSREKERRRRASAPVFKKQGKPTMFRSQPPKKKVEEKKDERADEEAELEAYLARDMV
ncbi:DUF4200 domain-containing protein [Haematococcus lacustris]|uniref:DUF4200 domain-containing protein n=1 Tax=Haematococcus lacustris TaxID=44745 RepID=A0A699ZEF4_HAELA|nr:DUF4200 domain-containing protein [Haematococcus lacustris]